MTADEARELFSEAYEGELSGARRDAFDVALAADAALAEEYSAFEAALSAAAEGAADEVAAPDLLPGVQRQLRARSRGRFYADRFAERRGTGFIHPVALGLGMVLLLVFAWAAFQYINAIEVRPPASIGADAPQIVP